MEGRGNLERATIMFGDKPHKPALSDARWLGIWALHEPSKDVMVFYLCTYMAASDTSAEAEKIMCRLYRNMTPAQKIQRIFSAYRMGKMLSMAGIRMAHPHATEDQVWRLWARRHFGDDLYEKAYQGRHDG